MQRARVSTFNHCTIFNAEYSEPRNGTENKAKISTLSTAKQKTISGFLWQVVGLLAQNGTAFLATIVLARFLTKEDFGLIAIAIGTVQFCEMLRYGGITQAYVAYHGEEAAARHTAFWLSIIPGALFTLALIFLAPFAAVFFQAPGLSPILTVLAFTHLIDSFRIVPHSTLLRQERLREKAIAEAIPFIFSALIAIVAAIALPPQDRVWALVMMYFARYFGIAVLFNIFSPYIPKFSYSPDIGKVLITRGLAILFSNIPATSLEQINFVILGKRIGEGGVGVFRLAWNVTTPTTVIAHAANWTLFRPIAVAAHENTEKLQSIFLRSLRAISLLSTATLTWLILVAQDLIPLLLGPNWNDAIPPAKWLCFAVLVRTFTYICTNAMQASGTPLYASITWWITFLLGVALLLFYPMAIGDALIPSILTATFYAISALLALTLAAIAFKIPFFAIIEALLPSIIACGLASLASAVILYSKIFDAVPLARLAITTIVYALVFLPLCGKMMGIGYKALFQTSGWKQLLRAT